ncbi:hypothetical protein ABH966_001342 [Lysinibacillus sp. RC46]|uniref:hypothetical protein n=1 Tax=unclassified Lysinibacillus TaxID=2636778 RepID=UPI003512370E
MKLTKMLTPFLIAGVVLSTGSNSSVKASSEYTDIDWDKAWESFEVGKYPNTIELFDPNEISNNETSDYGISPLANEAFKYTNGKTTVKGSGSKVTSTGYSQDGGIMDVITAKTSISTAGLSPIQGNFASTTVLSSSSKATSTIETNDLSGTNAWSGLTYHTVNRFTSNITFTGYTSDSINY